MVGDVRQTVGMAEHHVGRMRAAVEQQAYLLLAGRALLGVGNDRTTGTMGRLGSGRKGFALMRRELSEASSNFDHASSIG